MDQAVQDEFNYNLNDLLQLWRIEKLKAVKVSSENQGQFYTGDSYILLKKNPQNDTFAAHFWLGNASTQVNINMFINHQ